MKAESEWDTSALKQYSSPELQGASRNRSKQTEKTHKGDLARVCIFRIIYLAQNEEWIGLTSWWVRKPISGTLLSQKKMMTSLTRSGQESEGQALTSAMVGKQKRQELKAQ